MLRVVSGVCLALLLAFQVHGGSCVNGFETLPLSGVRLQGPNALFRVADEGTFRTMYVQDRFGAERLGSRISLLQPEIPVETEHRELLASFLLTPVQGHSVVIGMRNLGLIRFLRSFTPAQYIDVLESDATMITAASDYFGIRSDERLTIRRDPALEFLITRPKKAYDVVYMDHELPGCGSETDSRLPKLIRTPGILESVRERLSENGSLVIAFSGRCGLDKDIDRVIRVFPHVFVWEVPGEQKVIMAALKKAQIVNPLIYRERARRLDQKMNAGFSFERFIDRILAGEYRARII